jgi:hypothetical protein
MIRNIWHNTSPQVRWLLLIYILTLPLLQPWVNSDGIAYYSQLRSIIIDHNLQFENEFRHYQEQFRQKKSSILQKLQGVTEYTPAYDEEGLFSPDEPKTVTGHTPNRTSFGPAILWLPFFLFGHLLALIAQMFGAGNVADGYSLYYVFPVTLGTTLYGILGLLLSYRFANIFVSQKSAFLSTIAIWFSSPLIYYMYLVPTMAHVLSIFVVALFLYCWISWRNNVNNIRILILGIFGGIISLVRWQNVLFLIIPLLDIILVKQQRKLSYLLYLGFGFLFGFLPQMIVWKIVYGSFLLIPMGNETMQWFQPQFFSVLFSTRHGLFTWTPIFVFSILGLIFLYKKEPRITLYLLLAFLLQVYINAVPTNWWCGSSFGYRRLLDCLPIFILGLAMFLEIVSQKVSRRILYPVIGILILWNIGFMAQFVFGMVNHTQPVSFLEVAVNQFTRVPQKIETIIRYLFFRH